MLFVDKLQLMGGYIKKIKSVYSRVLEGTDQIFFSFVFRTDPYRIQMSANTN
jgi:hypothetical protein